MERAIVQINATEGQISANLEEVKNYLNEELEIYRTAKFDDEGIKMAKNIRADLRADRDDLKKRITEAKKKFMKPWDDFKVQLDEIVNLYEEPINQIDTQVKDFEERQKVEKRKVIAELYSDVFAELPEFTLESIYNPRWENATYKKNEITKDMYDIRNEIVEALSTIQSFRNDAVPKAVEMYKANRNLSEAITYIHKYEAMQREILEKQRAEEEERIRREERERILAEQRAEEERRAAIETAKAETEQAIMESMVAPVEEGAEVIDYIYAIEMTKAQREALEIYMDSCGLEWEVLNV